ncbi:hypothetical protein ADUPG1_006467 [Aduncisulcus paluster]|uniref:Uncharacterized protein n=1 Tax=Aduncisulcus paluster TaxID=2918883 RepID=A0ABQ5KID6_9EUKA|nr:hypothetical protein ADUPG1_006467 [Aduncisulcus paluster]
MCAKTTKSAKTAKRSKEGKSVLKKQDSVEPTDTGNKITATKTEKAEIVDDSKITERDVPDSAPKAKKSTSKENPRTTVEDEGAEKVSHDAERKTSDIDSSQLNPVTSPTLQSLAPIVPTEDPYVKLGRLESVERQTVLNYIAKFEELSERQSLPWSSSINYF